MLLCHTRRQRHAAADTLLPAYAMMPPLTPLSLPRQLFIAADTIQIRAL